MPLWSRAKLKILDVAEQADYGTMIGVRRQLRVFRRADMTRRCADTKILNDPTRCDRWMPKHWH